MTILLSVSSYDNFAFNEFFAVCEHCSEQLPLTQVSHNSNANFTCYYTWHLGLAIVGRIHGLHHCGGFDSVYVHVNINDQSVMIEMMKIACLEIIVSLYVELSCKFFLL